MKNVYIGYWYNEHDEETKDFPVPVKNSATDEEVRKMVHVLDHLIEPNSSMRYYKGISMCRVCNCMNHSGEYLKRYKEPGKPMVILVVPEGLRHYIEKHNVLVPQLIELYGKMKI